MDETPPLIPSYPIEILAASAPRLDAERFGRAVAARLGAVTRSAEEPAGELWFIPGGARFAGAGRAASSRLVLREGRGPDRAGLQDVLSQSFDIEDGAARLDKCQASITMTAVAAPDLADRDCRVMIAAGLMALLECVDAELVCWTPSGQILDPAKVRSKLSEPGQRANPTYGFVNVRLFNVAESGTAIMDTLGLGALGLTDLQIHFRDLDKAGVADLLYSVGAYLIDRGNIIDNGDTVPGLLPGESWTCLHAISLVGPDRLVLDIDPGPAFSARGDG